MQDPQNAYLAPGSPNVASSLRMPGARQLPAPDDHIVEPETREEMVRGERMFALPAMPAHGDGHSMLHSVISHHVRPPYVPSIDLLTRFDEGSDFASDVCIRKEGRDAEGRRYLEEVAFEVVAEQTRSHMTIRAETMIGRGVRRVLAIFTDDQTVEEWLPDERRWHVLDLDESLTDPTLVRPLLVRALLDASLGLNEVVKAAELKRVPRTLEIRAEGLREGKREGLREGKREGLREGEQQGKRELIEVFAQLQGIPLPPARRRTLLELDDAGLDELFRHLVTARCWPE
jgi:hypothetical protein